ncbi:uncharacterized protein [Ptychodera flava]|uniref:uncharacterized protein n=1 Tax=Ptychodera flava TaxID=63121 RepID=UPI00396A1A0B
MAAYAGCVVRIGTDDGEFEGVLHALDGNSKKITLKKVKYLDSGKTLQGLLHFYGHEVKCLDVIEDDKVTKQKSSSLVSKNNNSKFASGSISLEVGTAIHEIHEPLVDNMSPSDQKVPSRPDKSQDSLQVQGGSSLEGAHKVSTGKSENEDVSEDNKTGTLTIQSGEDSEQFSVDYSLVDDIDEIYFAAIHHISQQKFIAINMEGVLIGRQGTICVLQVATRQHVFLFDMIKLGLRGFNQGLGEVLECKVITKVMHDCRQPSDALFHLYGLKLVNVFDTQVADVIVWRNRNGGDLPRYVRGQVACLLEHMNLTLDQVYFQRVRSKCIEIDQAVWTQRPLSQYLIEAAVKDVMYLLDLRIVLMECMLEEFTQVVDIYLSEVRDKPNETNMKSPNTSHLLPNAVYEMSLQAKQTSVRNHSRFQGIHHWDENGFRENHHRIIDPNVMWSREIWHEGKDFVQTSKSRDHVISVGARRATHLSPNQRHLSSVKNLEPGHSSGSLCHELASFQETKTLPPSKIVSSSSESDSESETSSDDEQINALVLNQMAKINVNETHSKDNSSKIDGLEIEHSTQLLTNDDRDNGRSTEGKRESNDMFNCQEKDVEKLKRVYHGEQDGRAKHKTSVLGRGLSEKRADSIKEKLTSLLEIAKNDVKNEDKMTMLSETAYQNSDGIPCIDMSTSTSSMTDMSDSFSSEDANVSPTPYKKPSQISYPPEQFMDAEDCFFLDGTLCIPTVPHTQDDVVIKDGINSEAMSYDTSLPHESFRAFVSESPEDSNIRIGKFNRADSQTCADVAGNGNQAYSESQIISDDLTTNSLLKEDGYGQITPGKTTPKLGFGRATALMSHSDMMNRSRSPKDLYLIRGSMVECDFPLDDELCHSYNRQARTRKDSQRKVN